MGEFTYENTRSGTWLVRQDQTPKFVMFIEYLASDLHYVRLIDQTLSEPTILYHIEQCLGKAQYEILWQYKNMYFVKRSKS